MMGCWSSKIKSGISCPKGGVDTPVRQRDSHHVGPLLKADGSDNHSVQVCTDTLEAAFSEQMPPLKECDSDLPVSLVESRETPLGTRRIEVLGRHMDSVAEHNPPPGEDAATCSSECDDEPTVVIRSTVASFSGGALIECLVNVSPIGDCTLAPQTNLSRSVRSLSCTMPWMSDRMNEDGDTRMPSKATRHRVEVAVTTNVTVADRRPTRFEVSEKTKMKPSSGGNDAGDTQRIHISPPASARRLHHNPGGAFSSSVTLTASSAQSDRVCTPRGICISNTSPREPALLGGSPWHHALQTPPGHDRTNSSGNPPAFVVDSALHSPPAPESGLSMPPGAAHSPTTIEICRYIRSPPAHLRSILRRPTPPGASTSKEVGGDAARGCDTPKMGGLAEHSGLVHSPPAAVRTDFLRCAPGTPPRHSMSHSASRLLGPPQGAHTPQSPVHCRTDGRSSDVCCTQPLLVGTTEGCSSRTACVSDQPPTDIVVVPPAKRVHLIV